MGQGGGPGAIAGATLGGTLGGVVGGVKGAAIGGTVGAGLGSLGISPRKLEFGVQGLTAGVGQTAARLADIPLGAKKDFPFQGEEALKHTPVAGEIASRFTGSQVDQTLLTESKKFYDSASRFQEVKRTFANLEKTQPDQARGYLESHKNEFRLADLSTNIQQRVGQINSLMNQVRTEMTQPGANAQDGYSKLERLYNLKVEMMKRFNSAAQALQQGTQAAPSRTEGWHQ